MGIFEAIEKIRSEWGVIKTAPYLFFIAFLIAAGLGWTGASLIFSTRLENERSRSTLLREQLDQIRTSISTAPTAGPKPVVSPVKTNSSTLVDPDENRVKPTALNGIDPKRLKAPQEGRPTYEADLSLKRFIGAPVTVSGIMTNFASSERHGTVFLGKTADGFWPTLEFSPAQFAEITKMQVGDGITVRCVFKGIGSVTIFLDKCALKNSPLNL